MDKLGMLIVRPYAGKRKKAVENLIEKMEISNQEAVNGLHCDYGRRQGRAVLAKEPRFHA